MIGREQGVLFRGGHSADFVLSASIVPRVPPFLVLLLCADVRQHVLGQRDPDGTRRDSRGESVCVLPGVLAGPITPHASHLTPAA